MPFDRDLGPPHHDANERLIIGVRFVAALVMFAALMTGTGPLHSTVVKLFVLAYTIHAAGLLVVNSFRPEWGIGRAGLLHVVDMVWAAAATTASGGVNSHIFPFFIFVLVTGAFRWGMWHTALDASLILLLASAQGVAAAAGLTTWPFEWDTFIVQSSFVVGVGLLLGVFAERERAVRLQALATAALVSRLTRAPRLGPAMRDALAGIVRMFGATRALLVVEEPDTRTRYLWQADTGRPGGVAVSFMSLSGDEAAAWLPDPSTSLLCCEVRRSPDAPGRTTMAVATDGRAEPGAFAVPPAVAAAAPWTVLLIAPLSVNRVWDGQLYILEPGGRPRGELRLRLLHRVVEQVSPALLTLYLLRRMRTRAESIERTRISKELHAGALQSLAALEMRLEVLRREADAVAPALAADVLYVRDLLHDTAIDVRELMYRLRASRVDARRLPDDLHDLVERFGRTTGISAQFERGVNTVSLTSHQCAAVMRLMQEALFAGLRHSFATRVRVRMEADASAWALIIEHNGRATEPRGLPDRVAALGGTVQAHSSAEGSTLEMIFPQAGETPLAILAAP